MGGERRMELSKRLQAVADLVTAGYRVADIGTDHAYIPIFLLASGKIPGAAAMDVNEGPLERARCHIEENGLTEKISLRLSDGLAGLRPGEAESVVIAGMGGGLIIRILTEGAEALKYVKECVLQPQSEIEKVRAFLLKEGFLFIREDMVMDDGKYYPMMKVQPPNSAEKAGTASDGSAASEVWSETELRYGKLLLENRNETLRDFLKREIQIKRQILAGLTGRDSERIEERRRVLEQELEYAEKGMEYYAV